jgi:hypothetical protein
MAIIKCTECGEEISTNAKTCPHCGNPQATKSSSLWSLIGGFLFLILIGLVLYFLSVGLSSRAVYDQIYQFFKSAENKESRSLQKDSTSVSGKNIQIQKVNNLGYEFYLGEIETPGTTNITDDLKNQITKIAYTAKFPTNLLKNIPIIILNNLALTGDQYISVPAGNLKVPDLKPDFLSEGGMYGTFSGGGEVIFINKSIIGQGQFSDVLAHELGHAIGHRLTDKEWAKFYDLRNIPTGTVRDGTNWNMSPQEDFAEVYKNVFIGLEIKTFYGFLEGKYQGLLEIHCRNTTSQSCRREVMTNPSKYSSDWTYGVPYVSTVGPQTKSFINDIVSRLNQGEKSSVSAEDAKRYQDELKKIRDTFNKRKISN